MLAAGVHTAPWFSSEPWSCSDHRLWEDHLRKESLMLPWV